MIFHYINFPDVWVRASSLVEARELIQKEVEKYSYNEVREEEVVAVPSEGPTEVIHVNTA